MKIFYMKISSDTFLTYNFYSVKNNKLISLNKNNNLNDIINKNKIIIK